MKKGTRKALAGILVIGLGVSFLIYRGIATTSAYYLTVAELRGSDLGRKLSDKDFVRVGGEVVAGTIDYDQKNLTLLFSIRDMERPGEMIATRYEGPKPDAFEPDIDVLVEGTYTRGENLFHARTLLVKCPSKYESEKKTQ
ncbi:MAG: cytochrome c maturation protein CcmE [Candidatus Geothermincolia bacterium]